MRIAYIAAGAAGMYCGSCIHDNTLAAALQRLGHEVALIPTYTPIRTDETSVSIDKIFYGGINVYLQEKIAFFRHTPWIFDRLLNSPAILNRLARMSASTNAKDLGRLTVSVLQGEHGHQKKELAKLIHWLKTDYRPDLVQLTNSMFVGMARMIRQELGVPVLCAMQGEDLFLDDLEEPYKQQAHELLRQRAQDVDGFIATSEYYADFMQRYIQVPHNKIHVVRLGINLDGHGQKERLRKPGTPLTVGYLARICPEKGLHVLVEAVDLINRRDGEDEIRLKVAGYLGEKDKSYFESIQRQVDNRGLAPHFEYVGEVDRQQKISFLNELDVFSVPAVYRDPKGLPVIEALANGVPVVQPNHGAFPELIAATQGGRLVEPNSPSALAEGLLELLHDDALRTEAGRRGKAAVAQLFGDRTMAQSTVAVYQHFLDQKQTSPTAQKGFPDSQRLARAER